MQLTLSFVVLVLSATAATAVSAQALDAKITRPSAIYSSTFKLPGNNIHCQYLDHRAPEPAFATFLRCDIESQLKPMPPRPKNGSCDLDWGGGLVLLKASKTEVLCAGDTINGPTYPTLQYGQTWKKSGFTCQSSAKGLTCINSKKQGFFLSRQEWRSF